MRLSANLALVAPSVRSEIAWLEWLAAQTLNEGGGVDLIRFVISGQSIHGKINAKAQRHFPLIGNFPLKPNEGNVILIQSPSGRPVITADNHAGNAVAGSAVCVAVNPDLAIGPAAGKNLNQIKRFCQNMIFRDFFKAGYIEIFCNSRPSRDGANRREKTVRQRPVYQRQSCRRRP